MLTAPSPLTPVRSLPTCCRPSHCPKLTYRTQHVTLSLDWRGAGTALGLACLITPQPSPADNIYPSPYGPGPPDEPDKAGLTPLPPPLLPPPPALPILAFCRLSTPLEEPGSCLLLGICKRVHPPPSKSKRSANIATNTLYEPPVYRSSLLYITFSSFIPFLCTNMASH